MIVKRVENIRLSMAALAAHRELLGDVAVDTALGALQSQLIALTATPSTHEPAEHVATTAINCDAGMPPGAGPAQQLKMVSVLFLDMVGSTSLSTRLDPEDVHDIVDGSLAAYAEVVQAHGGRVLQYAGDNLLAAFGTPVAHEDDAVHAVQAGLALLAEAQVQERRLHALKPELEGELAQGVRVGIHSGDVLLGGGVDGEGTIRGYTVNIAARMEQTAPVGALRISQATWRQVRGRFVVDEQAPLQVKGSAEPLQTYLVRGPAVDRQRVARGVDGVVSRLVGRHEEFDQLQAACDALCHSGRAGSGSAKGVKRVSAGHARLPDTPGPRLRMLLLSGAPGVGKTRLCDDFRHACLARVDAPAWRAVRASTSHMGSPYAVLRCLLQACLSGQAETPVTATGLARDWLFACDPLLGQPGDAAVLGHLLGLDHADHPEVRPLVGEPRQLRDRGHFHAAQLLRQLVARDGPLLLFIDDLQWCDDATLDFIIWLDAQLADLALLLLATARPELATRRPGWQPACCTVVNLKPLDAADRQDLAHALLAPLTNLQSASGADRDAAAASIPVQLLELLTEHSEGNPYFMEELVNTLIDRGVLDTHTRPWLCRLERLTGLQLPATLVGLLQARLDALTPDLRRTAQLASVVGDRFWDDSLAALDAPLPAGLHGLIEHELAQASHPSSLDDLSEFLFRNHSVQQVAYDSVLKRVRRQLHARIAHWLQARPSAAPHDLIAEHFERGGLPDRALQHWQFAADAAAARYANTQALMYADRALALLDAQDLERRYALVQLQVRVLNIHDERARRAGCVDELLALAQAITKAAEAGGGDVTTARARLAEALGFKSWFHFDTADLVQAQLLGEQAMLAARSAGPEASAKAMARLAQTQLRRGQLAQARDMLQQALSFAMQVAPIPIEGDLHNDLGNLYSEQGDFALSRHHYEQALVCVRRIDKRNSEAGTVANLAYTTLQLGDYQAAQAQCVQAMALFNRIGNLRNAAVVRINLAMSLLHAGDPASAYDEAECARAALCELNDQWAEAAARRVIGQAAARLGRHDAAQAQLLLSRSQFDALGLPHLAFEAWAALAAAWRLGGQLERATQAARAMKAALAEGVNLDGTEEPALVGLTLFELLAESHEPAAPEVLESTHASLMTRARSISNLVERERYLQAVPYHAKIVACWQGRAASDAHATRHDA